MAPDELSEEARKELLEICEDQFAQLKKVKAVLSPDCSFLLPILPPSIPALHYSQLIPVCVETNLFLLQLHNDIILSEADSCETPQEQVRLQN